MLAAPIADARVLRGASATITATITDQDGEPVAPGGTVTVDVTRADGTVIEAGRTTTAVSGSPGVYTAALNETATLDVLTCAWKDGTTPRVTTHVEVVGGYYFSTGEVRAFDRSLVSESSYPDAQILAARREVEDECERITGVAWVPRYRRVTFAATGERTVVLPDPAVRTIRTVTALQNPGATLHTYTSDELAQLTCDAAGILTSSDVRFDGQVTVEYEHGNDRPPSDLRHATLTRLRGTLNRENSGVPSNATSFVPAGGGANFTVAQPGRAGFETGIPEVDAVYLRPGINMRTPGIG